MAVVVAPRPELSIWDRLYLPPIFRGLMRTLKHFFSRKATMQFPEEEWK